MTAWRMAGSLEQLLGQINNHYPTRSTVSDGGKGDDAHAARNSDHNPDATGVVHARDFTHDPAVFDAHAFADRLVAARDPRVSYVISRGRISLDNGSWLPYMGTNPHNKHVHVSVVPGPAGDDVRPWPAVPTKGHLMPHAVSPFTGRYTQKYGTSGGYAGHLGIDIAPPSPGQTGKPVRAMFAGTVVRAARGVRHGNRRSTWAPGRTGNGVLIRNADGEAQGYNHVTPAVKAGQRVAAGEVIGYNDRSGNQTAPHLHFETWADWRNPASNYDPARAFRRFALRVGGAPAGGTGGSSGGGTSKPATKPKPAKKWPDANLSAKATKAQIADAWYILMAKIGHKDRSATQRRQRWLKAQGTYKGALDGKWGRLTTKALQQTLAKRGFYHGVIDAVAGPMLRAAEIAFLNSQRKTNLK
ncbi:peptidoglycan DD-metalloendopeptidase family protein [Galactobacter caseinivorans]|uniref:M23ase beta-sheet core domain-containing protein n=1 Tax=Galactobacter caseinivorans TaxID=2676123 RepID=A0A496PMT9_9MICC|nr:peptidoglycan DD-metalloendopeptidase family protein [Galactobacter caseinivorans]RKW71734.1 hypothetical protein DWQ67_02595 [Galactobacter caseinivorans]